MIRIFSIRYIASCILIATPFSAFATSCNEESPYLKTLGDGYYDIDVTPTLTGRQKSAISKMFSPFENKRLVGNGKLVDCIGPENNAKKITTTTMLSAQLSQQSDGKVALNINAFDKHKKSSQLITLDYFGYNNPYRIIMLSDNRLILSYKIRQKKIMKEALTEISLSSRSLTIKTDYYISGHFGYQNTWNLHLE